MLLSSHARRSFKFFFCDNSAGIIGANNPPSSVGRAPPCNPEATTLRITGLDGSFSISGAVTVVAGTGTERVWSVSASDLSNVFVNLPENYSGTVDFGVAAVATESDGKLS